MAGFAGTRTYIHASPSSQRRPACSFEVESEKGPHLAGIYALEFGNKTLAPPAKGELLGGPGEKKSEPSKPGLRRPHAAEGERVSRLAASGIAAPLASAAPGDLQLLNYDPRRTAGRRRQGNRGFPRAPPLARVLPLAAAPCRAGVVSLLRLSLTPGRPGATAVTGRPFAVAPAHVLVVIALLGIPIAGVLMLVLCYALLTKLAYRPVRPVAVRPRVVEAWTASSAPPEEARAN
jgi:hypothetical protein